MPLFMDYHIVSDISIDDMKQGHMANMSVHDKYGVKYVQFWVNQEAGTIFCPIEAPVAKSCEAVHQKAHDNIACNIVKAVTERSPVAFIRDLRLSKALSLIKENRYNFSEVVPGIGFLNPFYFAKCFSKNFGVIASNVAV